MPKMSMLVMLLVTCIAATESTFEIEGNQLKIILDFPDISANSATHIIHFNDMITGSNLLTPGTVHTRPDGLEIRTDGLNPVELILETTGCCSDMDLAVTTLYSPLSGESQSPEIKVIENTLTLSGQSDSGADQLSKVHPNPFCSEVLIETDLQGELFIFDITGKIVRDLNSTGTGITWDGLDNAGVELPAGTYFYRQSNGKRNIGGQIHLVK